MRVCENMVVTSRCFAFLALITQARIWKSFWVKNSTSLIYLPIPTSAETSKIFANMLCQFFLLKLTFKREKSVFWKAAFLQNKNWLRVQDYVYKTSRQCKNFSFNQCHNKEFFCFFSGKLIYKSSRKLFSLYLHRYKHSTVVMQTLDFVSGLHTVSNSPNPSPVYIRLCKHRKRFLLLKKSLEIVEVILSVLKLFSQF